MSEHWYCTIDNEECGPFSHAELLEMVQSGVVGPDDRVRTQKSNVWIPARRVAGLFPSETPTSQADAGPQAESSADSATGLGGWRAAWQRRKTLWGVLAVVLLCGVGGAIWWFNRDTTFPESQSLGDLHVPAERKEASRDVFRAPKPVVPSLVGLKEGVPYIVPGFEKIDPAFSPCLTQDLKLIVYAGHGPSGRGYDLFLATREKTDAPFGPPQRIASCASPQLEAYPAISPDGLELIFIRSSRDPQLMSCSRPDRSSAFNEPAPWPVPELTQEDGRPGRPQFIDQNRVAFSLMGEKAADRQIFLTERSKRGSDFLVPAPIPFTDVTPPYFIARNMLRAYFGWPKGIDFAVRSQQGDATFGAPRKLVEKDVTGPIDGPLWVAPKEDVIIYCSPGPGEKLGSARKLWMIRY